MEVDDVPSSTSRPPPSRTPRRRNSPALSTLRARREPTAPKEAQRVLSCKCCCSAVMCCGSLFKILQSPVPGKICMSFRSLTNSPSSSSTRLRRCCPHELCSPASGSRVSRWWTSPTPSSWYFWWRQSGLPSSGLPSLAPADDNQNGQDQGSQDLDCLLLL